MHFSFSKLKEKRVLLEILLFSIFVFPIFNDLAYYSLPNNIFSEVNFILNIIRVLILGATLITTFKLSKKMIFFNLVILIILLYNAIFLKNDFFQFSYFKNLFLNVLVPSWCILSINDFKQVKKMIIDLEIPISILLYFDFFMSFQNWEYTYNIWLANQMFFCCAISLYNCFYSKRKISFALLIFSFFILFVSGSRSPILVLLIMLFSFLTHKIIILYKNADSLKRKKIKLILSVSFCGMLFLIILIYSFIGTFDQFLLSRGYNIRFIHLLANGSILDSSGRFSIFYPNVINLISENPVFGYGINDLVPICEAVSKTSCTFASSQGYYPHNIILEIFYSFGIIIGGFLLFFYSVMIKKAIKIDFSFTIFILGIGIIPLFLSGSLWSFENFWIVTACFLLCINADLKIKFSKIKLVKEKKHKERNNL